jgi:glucoamylase
MVNSATALLAAGDKETALRALIYLAVSQHPDGGFAQNFWVNGSAYWSGIQLDETAFPILLAWRLHCEKDLADFDPSNLVRNAAVGAVRFELPTLCSQSRSDRRWKSVEIGWE